MREPLTIAAALLAGGCTFGTLKTDDCLSRYSEGMAIAVAEARQAGSVVSESYDYCLDGRRRADSMLQVLQSRGFATEGPHKHFEVPGGWCLSAGRAAIAGRFNPTESLAAVCAVGHSSRAVLTGGRLTSSDGKRHDILSDLDRKATEELERRLANRAEL